MPMRRIFCFAVILCLLTACVQKPAKSPPTEAFLPSASTEPSPVKEVPAAVLTEPSAEPPSFEAASSPLEIVLPEEYLDALIVTTEFPDTDPGSHRIPLLRVQERASVEALEKDYGTAEGGGFLFGIVQLDQAGLEEHLLNDYGGMWVFAHRDQTYYAMTHPTDVQFYRSETASAEEWAQWESLSALGHEVCEDFRVRNGLETFRTAYLYDHAYTYEGEHAYAVYYPYFTFDGSTAEQYTFVLSQPAKQGDGGIWCVERWYDEYGTCYLNFPGNGTSSTEHYAALQAECDNGTSPDLLTPLGAAKAFVENSYWFSEEVTEENVVLTKENNSDYAEANRLMSHTVASLLVSPNDVTDREILRCVGSFTPDTWGVMGRTFYDSDWWPPLQEALEKVAMGTTDQDYRTKCIMRFYLTSYGHYRDFIAGILKTQYAADFVSFEAALAAFDNIDEEVIRNALG